MHELSISRSIADLVLKEAEKAKATRVISVEVEIGELSFLNAKQSEDIEIKRGRECTIRRIEIEKE